MISVLVPVYQTSITELAEALSRQLLSSGQAGELLFLDDGSEEPVRYENRTIKDLPFVSYSELPRNTGRLQVRRRLAEMARYDWLLFLDADSRILHDHFLSTYLQQLSADDKVIAGGRVVAADPPNECRFHLHWQYGREREGTANPHRGFQTNNFCIRKDLFLQLTSGSELQGYGHEDTLLGIRLKQAGIPVLHIHNAVEHAGLEPADVFLKKSEEALVNLLHLEQMVGSEALQKEVRLFHWYLRLQRLGLLKLVDLANRPFTAALRNNLHSCHPSLRLFDLYRLIRLYRLGRKR